MTAEFLTGLIAANLAASAAVLAALVLRRPLRRLAGARAAYALWLIVPVAMLASLAPPRTAAQAIVIAPIRPAAQAAVEWITVITPSAAKSGPDASLLLYLWLAGAAAFVIFLVVGQIRTLARFGILGRDKQGFTRAANRDLGPALIGLMRPTIVLPADFETRFDTREQAMILAHETTHLKDGHLWINALTALIRALSWFNPLVHLAAFYARVDQELACDAAVAERFPGERRTYAEAMLKTQLARAPLPLGCYWPGGSSTLLQERLEMLARTTPNLARRLMGAAAMAAILTGAGFAAWAATPEIPAAIEPAPAPAAEPAPAPAPEFQAVARPRTAPAGDVNLSNAGGTSANFPTAAAPAGSLDDAIAAVRAWIPNERDPENVEAIKRVLDTSDGARLEDRGIAPDGAHRIARFDAKGEPENMIFVHPNQGVGIAVMMRAPPPSGSDRRQIVPIPGSVPLAPPPN